MKLMFDLQVLAFQADITRVTSLLIGREQSGRSFPEIGVVEPHHSLSHHRDDPAFIAKKAKIDAYHIKLYSYFLEKLDATADGDGSLLDHSIIMYGAGLGNPNLHEHSNLPVLLAGGGAGTLKTGRHVAYAAETPMTNLLVSLLDKVGVRTDSFGDSTGPLDHLSARHPHRMRSRSADGSRGVGDASPRRLPSSDQCVNAEEHRCHSPSAS